MKTRVIISFCIIAVLLPVLLLGQSIDGVVEEDEYSSSLTFDDGKYILSWSVRGKNVFIAMSAETTGWVAIGFDPTEVMAEADMIFGWVDDEGKAYIVDTYSEGPYGPHPPDEVLGGTQDIIEYAGSERDGRTIIEFSHLKNTEDQYDKLLFPEGGNSIIWAHGFSDDFNEIHIKTGYGWLDIEGGEESKTGKGWLLIIHIIIMSVAFIIMVFGMLVSRYMKKKRWWLKVHRSIGITGASVGVIGIASAVIMVSVLSGIHLRVFHSYVGLVTILALISTPVLGQSIFKVQREKKPKFRKSHRWFGRIALILMLITIILGLFQAGIL
jgi:hypothetical protein